MKFLKAAVLVALALSIAPAAAQDMLRGVRSLRPGLFALGL